MSTFSFVRPFLKWAGGKRYLLPEIKKRLPRTYKTYVEPFLGGGAVLFHLQPKQAIVNDINAEVINVYQVVRDYPDALIVALEQYRHTASEFYRLRALDRDEQAYAALSPVERAARIIYLNKTCFNGLFRVNAQGQFNAPFGNYNNPNIVNEEVLRAVSAFLNQHAVDLVATGFETLLPRIEKGSFVYLDPPYDPVSDTASFTGYSLQGFGKQDQRRLKDFCDALHDKGVKFLLSNSATDFIKDLYRGYRIDTLAVPRSINAVGSKRGKIDELLIRNYA